MVCAISKKSFHLSNIRLNGYAIVLVHLIRCWLFVCMLDVHFQKKVSQLCLGVINKIWFHGLKFYFV